MNIKKENLVRFHVLHAEGYNEEILHAFLVPEDGSKEQEHLQEACDNMQPQGEILKDFGFNGLCSVSKDPEFEGFLVEPV